MKSVSTTLAIVLVISVFGLLPEARAEKTTNFQIIVEGGLVLPYGELGQGFHETPLGFGASKGFEAGFRLRYNLTPFLSLAPAFHFISPGKFSSEDEEYGEYRLQANSYRYTIELMLAQEKPIMGIQPFIAGGTGLFRDRYQGFSKQLFQEFDRSVNTLGFSVRAGIRTKGFELSWVYYFNRFSSYQFFESDLEQEYNWDAVTFRAGWIIPFSQ